MLNQQPDATKTQQNGTRPMTGSEYLTSLRDGREIWIYGQRVQDVTSHPAFRNQARMVARLYDALHDPASKEQLTCPTDTGSGGYTQRFFKASRTVEELLAAREAIAAWQRIGYGWMGRSPDFVAAFLGMLGPNVDLYTPYQANAQRWYKLAQEQVPYVNHAIANPPVDRRLAPDEADKLYIHVVKETDAGLIVSGAKNITTNAALTNYSFVAGDGGAFVKNKAMAVLFMTPMNAPGVKVICRPSYEMTASVMGSPFDYPLSSRFDENDAIVILDNVLVPWENVLIYGDANKYNNHMQSSGLYHRVGLQACTRLAVKLDLITGLLLQAVEATGVDQFRGVQVNLGEVITWRHLFWSLSDAMVHSVTTLNGTVIPKLEHLMSYRMLMATAYPRIKEITQQLVASGLIYQPSSALDFKTPELRPYLDQYVRGGDGDSVTRIKLMRTLWDALSSEFGGRHELYERNHSGNHEAVRLHPLFHAMSNGTVAQLKGFADQCMAEVDLDGWTAPDLINPHDVNFFRTPGQQPTAASLVNSFHPDPSPVSLNGNGQSSLPVAGTPVSAAERHQMLVEWNATTTDYPKERCIHQLFEEQVARTPDAVAVVAEVGLAHAPAANKTALTYRELNERANQLAHYLQQVGVGLNTQVAICSERSLTFVISVVAVLKAGGAYVPLDPSQPLERLTNMIADTQPTILLTQPQWLERLQPLAQHYPSLPVVCIERDGDASTNVARRIFLANTLGLTGKRWTMANALLILCIPPVQRGARKGLPFPIAPSVV
ncbi:MAG: 4-hydroxyphenylacetate 3-hydroxylase N-terminal domain-containing protein [Caldilineaceae bacterium]